MSWTCPECGKVLKRASSGPGHMERFHGDVWALAEQSLLNYQQLGGEISRLRTLRKTNDKWEPVYHAYVKVSGQADTRPQRIALRQKLEAERTGGRW